MARSNYAPHNRNKNGSLRTRRLHTPARPPQGCTDTGRTREVPSRSNSWLRSRVRFCTRHLNRSRDKHTHPSPSLRRSTQALRRTHDTNHTACRCSASRCSLFRSRYAIAFRRTRFRSGPTVNTRAIPESSSADTMPLHIDARFGCAFRYRSRHMRLRIRRTPTN